ncbi:hypothetical protein [Nocardia sp. NRRL S-836]|uniref:hypothetical protein n=1 Tax=Nocardia sp. NRRL S-836 TaxID=1519492 RepID=UPI0006AF8B34|nr:hypothetical protein [Nocardia sp. NRRL S-836]KOV84747.1 hypothetical protein ADL03_15905 [Nocardia sp. NRRL S-836]
MSKRRNNKVVSLAARRARQAQAHAARVRYVRLYSAAGVGRESAGVVVPMRRRVESVSDTHMIGVMPDGTGKFVAVCSCGKYRSNPMGERYAKGAGTRHVNAESAKRAATQAA